MTITKKKTGKTAWFDWKLYPIYFIIGVIPLIVKEYHYTNPLAEQPWYWDNQGYDFFLYWKSGALIAVAVVISLILFFSSNVKKSMGQRKIFIPLGIWMFLSGISAAVSKYRYFAIHGSTDQFESIFVLFSYGLCTYYCFVFVNTEEKLKRVIQVFFISSLWISLIGFTQAVGYDFYKFLFQKKDLNFNFESGRVYGTFYNPNYVGSYIALVLPVFLFLMLKMKEKYYKAAIGGIVLLLLINLIGSKSAAGFFSTIVTFLLILIFFLRDLKVTKQQKILGILISIAVFLLITFTFREKIKETYIDKLLGGFLRNTVEESVNLHQIETLEDCVRIHYKEDILQIHFLVLDAEKGYTGFDFMDGNGNQMEALMDEENCFSFTEQRFDGINVMPMCFSDINDTYGFTVVIDGLNWNFTNQTSDESYYYITNTGKFDKIDVYEKNFRTDYNQSFSGRGYIWARTIPLLKKTFFIGSGPDTFILTYPNADYINNANYSELSSIVTRPHNMYLQMAIQSGVLSLISFLIFYFWYFFESVKLYWNKKKDTFKDMVGFGIFIGSIGYMIAGMANDSSVTVAPIFWCFMGIGIKINADKKQK